MTRIDNQDGEDGEVSMYILFNRTELLMIVEHGVRSAYDR